MGSMLEYNGYHASIQYDAEDNIFVGEVFGITDSLNFHGSSIDELKQMFAQCIDNYLELCQTIGKEPDKEFKGTFNVRISPELHRRAALEAAQKNMTLNQYVSKAISDSVEGKVDSRETVIYVPYGTRQMEWENEMDCEFKSSYGDGYILTQKENIAYVGS